MKPSEKLDFKIMTTQCIGDLNTEEVNVGSYLEHLSKYLSSSELVRQLIVVLYDKGLISKEEIESL